MFLTFLKRYQKCLHILSRFQDIRNGKEKIRKQKSKIKALFTFL